MNKHQGFLAVLRFPKDASMSRNTHYRGIDRLPPYSPNSPGSQDVLDDYVFGKFKDEAGLIPNLSLAQELLRRFSGSDQEFEIIYVREYEGGPDARGPDLRFLGYDVAGQSPFWSVVGDLPEDEEITTFSELLNGHGLFDSVGKAAGYLERYRSRWLEDKSLQLSIWEIYVVVERIVV